MNHRAFLSLVRILLNCNQLRDLICLVISLIFRPEIHRKYPLGLVPIRVRSRR